MEHGLETWRGDPLMGAPFASALADAHEEIPWKGISLHLPANREGGAL